MNTKRIIPIILAGLFLITGFSVTATAQSFTISDASTMTLFGSANVTDWDAEIKTIRGEIVINKPDQAEWADAEISWFERVEITIPVEDIDADSRRMNNNMHEYLKEDDYPEITYEMVEAQSLAAMDNPGLVMTVRGIVTAAGEPVEITHDVTITENGSGNIVISGSKDLKMTDFGIDPPTAMLGSVRARDDMTIEFELILE